MSKLYDAMINNLFKKNGEGLENAVLEALTPTNLNADLVNPSKSPLSRAFILDVTKSLEEGFMFNTQQASSKSAEELEKEFTKQIEFIKENSKSSGFFRKETKDPFDAFVETQSSTFDFEPFKNALIEVQKTAPDAHFLSKLVCAVIKTKTSMDASEQNIEKMYEIEKQLIPYAYGYAMQNEKIKHSEIRDEIYSYFGLTKDSTRSRDINARKYLRGQSINYLIKTHTQNDASKHTDIENNSDDFGLITVYSKGEQGKLVTSADESKTVSKDAPIMQLIMQGQKINEEGRPSSNMKSLQQALIRIHDKLNSQNPISENRDFLTASIAYLLLAREAGVKDEGDFIGIALADPMTEIVDTLSLSEVKDICDKAYNIANEISKNELGKEIARPKQQLLSKRKLDRTRSGLVIQAKNRVLKAEEEKTAALAQAEQAQKDKEKADELMKEAEQARKEAEEKTLQAEADKKAAEEKAAKAEEEKTAALAQAEKSQKDKERAEKAKIAAEEKASKAEEEKKQAEVKKSSKIKKEPTELDLALKNLKRFYGLIQKSVLRKLTDDLDKYKEADSKLKKYNRELQRPETSSKKQKAIKNYAAPYEKTIKKFEKKYGSIEKLRSTINDIQLTWSDYADNIRGIISSYIKASQNLENKDVKSILSEIEKKISKSYYDTATRMEQHKAFFEFIKDFDNSKDLKLADIKTLAGSEQGKEIQNGIFRFVMTKKATKVKKDSPVAETDANQTETDSKPAEKKSNKKKTPEQDEKSQKEEEAGKNKEILDQLQGAENLIEEFLGDQDLR